jgi:hypothetical protein
MSFKERFVIPTRDQLGNLAGFSSVNRDSLIDVSYSATEHIVYIVLKSTYVRGKTTIDQVQATRVKAGKVEKIDGVYREHPIYMQEGYNHSITISDEKDMYNFWNWLHEDQSASEPLKVLRAEMLKAVEDAKVAAEKAAEQMKNKAEAEKAADDQINAEIEATKKENELKSV